MKNPESPVSKCINFLQTDIWRIRASTLSGQKSFWIRQLRIFLLAARGFAEDKCQLRASALTFFSLLSIVPVLAMAFGIAKGFGFEKLLERKLMTQLQGQEEVATKIIGFAQSFLEQTQGGLIAGVGIVILFWTVIKVLGNIEDSFNDIWGIKKARTFGRKFSDYLSIMLVCPILFIMSSSATVLIVSKVALIIEKLAFLGPVRTLIITSMQILPYAVIWVMFTFIYIFMPNTKVNFRSGLMAGIIAGTIYQIIQWAYITFQIGMSKYGAIYGSFAALPLFLVWLQISWLVVLMGAEISFAEQNVDTYEFEADSLKVSNVFKKLLALNITHVCIKAFHKGETPPTATQLSRDLEIPVRLVRQVIFELIEAGVLSEVKLDGVQLIGYHPARDIDDLTIQNVVDSLDRRGVDMVPVAETKTMHIFKDALVQFHNANAASPKNILLKNINI
ncbi:MAG: YihY/virulence factor BrkB family protein [Candidatus Omnitrophica bacterium]|nr:YihY/virulence factor BrkB family protein [Candidatus Omnitrophota bacterium]